jgi:NADH-quinone oxidoreductase subunit M
VLLFFAFLAAFSVKVPMWPVHTWLPDAHVEAPTGGSVVLAAIMLKLGAYGFLRFSMPIAPDASREYAWFIIALSLIAVHLHRPGGAGAAGHEEAGRLQLIAHMGFVTLGFFIFNELGVAGGIVQMISHGFVSGAMFLCIGVLYDRVHSREIAAYGGVVNTMPKFTAFAVLFAMANCGLPGTAGFVGEWMVILGAVKANFWIGRAGAPRWSSAPPTRCGWSSGCTSAPWPTTMCGADRHQRPRVPDARHAGRGRAVDGPVSQALHRRDADVR